VYHITPVLRPPLTIPIPPFDSAITSHIVALERLKERTLAGTTHPGVFFQIKSVFHLLESLGSARIEGNRTTIDELVEATITGQRDASEQLREISNIDDAMSWVESVFRSDPHAAIDEPFLRELHRLTVKNLRPPEQGGEGDIKPGAFRSKTVHIVGARHAPPSPFELPDLVSELVAFINAQPDARFDLLRIAIAHHRFEHIHPFRNGNGRVGRLLTYAMLIRSGFRVSDGRILNPSAVFCVDRRAYMTALERADSGTDDDLLAWCEFVLSGLRTEIEKIDRMLNLSVFERDVLQPALDIAKERGSISTLEWRILSTISREQVAGSSHFRQFYPDRSSSSVSQVIARFKRHELILPYPHPKSRTYIVNYVGKDLLRALVTAIERAGFLPVRREP
jgi:Fic family protein